MKTKAILSMLLLCTLTFTSCSDDKDEPTVGAAKQVAGTYTGDVAMRVQSITLDPVTDVAVSIEATSDDNATITFPAVTYGNYTIPAVTVENVAISSTDNNKSFTIAGTSVTTDAVALTINNGEIKDGQATISYSMVPGKMPMSINCDFTGTKK